MTLRAASKITPKAIGMAQTKTIGKMVDTTHPLTCADAENATPVWPRQIFLSWS
jgi:hypothetical protein